MLLDFTGAPHGGRQRLLPEWNTQPRITPVLILDHSIVGSAEGAWSMFALRSNLESHLIVKLTGYIWQAMDLDRAADANFHANRFPDGTGAISIETEDRGDPNTQPWTPEQIDSLIWLHDKLARLYPTIPRRRASAATGSGARGLGYHSLFGAPSAWTPAAGKTCPGRPARTNQWNTILLPRFLQGSTTATQEDLVMDDKTRKEISDLLDEKLDEKLGNLYRLLSKGVTADGKVSAAHQRISNEGIRNRLDDIS